MPFLPSEAEETKLLINQENERCLSFSLFTSDLVSLSYSNDLREFGTTKT
jgi:hypothetical protein